jgi:hypothetical protein
MRTRIRSLRSAAWLTVVGTLGSALPAQAGPVSLLFSGSIFNVSDPSDVFATTIGDTYTIQLNYDPDLLPATPSGDSSVYTSGAGESLITLSFLSSGGDAYTSDNSFPLTISVENTPDWLVTMTPGDGQDRFTLHAQLDAVTTLNLVLIESLGSNPLSSNDLPLGGFGGGPGTWSVSELDIDRTDLFANISGSVSTIETVAVPEPAVAWLMIGALAWLGLSRKTLLRARS